MNETAKTLAFSGVALVLLAAAALATWLPDWRGPGAGFDDQGQPFFPAFATAIDEDPLAARVLEVVEYDADTAEVRPFQVELRDGEWTIPSHYDYPADAQDRLARLAGQVAALVKGAIRSDRASDHEGLGVIDPLDEKTTSLQGRGTRITLRGAPGGEPMADLILGEDVPDRDGLRYVRLPGKNRTYAAEIDLDLTTRFADWIDPDLLAVTPSQSRRLSYDTRKVNPDARTPQEALIPGDPIVISRDGDGANDWTMDDLGPDEAVDNAKVRDVINAVDNLKVIGVRPLPSSSETVLLRSLASKGFYLTPRNELLSNEGSVSIATDEGIVYTLRFGEITLATGDALTSGVGEDQDPSAEAEADADADADAEGGESAPDEAGDDDNDGQTEGRYLIVSVAFNADLLPEDDDGGPTALPVEVFAHAPGDPARAEDDAKVAEEAARRQEERQRKITEAEEKVAELNRRFVNWYYVVPGDDFRKVALGRDAFIKAPGAPDSDASPTSPSPGGLDGFDPHGGLPPGLNLPGLGNPHG